jgi:hypothetical protein
MNMLVKFQPDIHILMTMSGDVTRYAYTLGPNDLYSSYKTSSFFLMMYIFYSL